MRHEAGSSEPGRNDGKQTVSRRGDWLRSVTGIVVSPRVGLRIIRRQAPWRGVFLVIAAVTMAELLLLRPYVLQAGSSIGDAGEQWNEVASVVSYVGLLVAPVVLLLSWLFRAFVIWSLAVAFGGDVRFEQAFSLTAHLGVVSFLGGAVSSFVWMLRGFESLSNPGAVSALGLNLLLSSDNTALNAIYASVTPFTIWYTVLLGVGAASVFRLSWQRALAVAGVFWTAATVFAVASSSLIEILFVGA